MLPAIIISYEKLFSLVILSEVGLAEFAVIRHEALHVIQFSSKLHCFKLTSVAEYSHDLVYTKVAFMLFHEVRNFLNYYQNIKVMTVTYRSLRW